MSPRTRVLCCSLSAYPMESTRQSTKTDVWPVARISIRPAASNQLIQSSTSVLPTKPTASTLQSTFQTWTRPITEVWLVKCCANQTPNFCDRRRKSPKSRDRFQPRLRNSPKPRQKRLWTSPRGSTISKEDSTVLIRLQFGLRRSPLNRSSCAKRGGSMDLVFRNPR